jgi:transposase-like protein
MECASCGSAAITERRDRMAQGYRRFCCRDCDRQFNERSGGILNRTQYAIASNPRLVVAVSDQHRADAAETANPRPMSGTVAA